MMNDKDLRQQAYQAVEKSLKTAQQDPYRQGFHMTPPVGLLNDPNGWIQWQGKYHMYFQWMPFHTGHGAKLWGHYSSDNLVDWELEPIALTPSDWFDKNGCYSGSAIDHDNKLKVFYTGNVRNDKGDRETYQCLAESDNGIDFIKKGVQVELPEGYTAHFRDPKVWKQEGKWYMVIGAQTSGKEGTVAFFESDDLEEWTHKGELAGPVDGLGYMWECPDAFQLDGKDVLIFSPQGVTAQGIDFNNQYQTGYVIGKIDYEYGKMEHGSFTELDRGFDFYAPQSMVDEKGRRLLVGWMGVPDQGEEHHPTIKHHWIHNLTLPRELRLEQGSLYQLPVEEMKQLREKKLFEQAVDSEISHEIARTSELIIETDGSLDHLELKLFDFLTLSYSKEEGYLTLERPNLASGEMENRSCRLIEGIKHVQVFIDRSSVEFFINKGKEVFTTRMFADPEERLLKVKQKGNEQLKLTAWGLKDNCIQQDISNWYNE
ncbi:glycoside hydrolase family 32 protein [Thalassobacillus sp. B23F22_16]|uniref:glycoside hydrolase family 32 protein n=1 Tax=Thalassobacillus sp. B23F22_16 TaxID=3459513 RepID=UPI00373FBB0A